MGCCSWNLSRDSLFWKIPFDVVARETVSQLLFVCPVYRRRAVAQKLDVRFFLVRVRGIMRILKVLKFAMWLPAVGCELAACDAFSVRG